MRRRLTLIRALWMSSTCLVLLPHLPSILETPPHSFQLILPRAPLPHAIAAAFDGRRLPEPLRRDGKSQIPIAVAWPILRSFNDTDAESSNEPTHSTFAPLALVLCPSSRAPALISSGAVLPNRPVAVRFFVGVDPFRPRPPPASIAL